MKQVFSLLVKDFRVDWRTRYPVAGTLLYLVTLVMTSYFAVSGFLSDEIWVTLLWLLLLFVSVTAIAKGFVQEEDRSFYYFFLVPPVALIFSKLLYHAIYHLVLSLLTWVLFSLFFGSRPAGGLFFLVLFCGSLGLSSTFTFISAMAAKTTNPSVMMAVLGFPILIPILILAIQSTITIVLGGVWAAIQTNFLTLVSLNVIIIALSFILFPFIWKS